jgi:hypothetical protein
VTPEQVRHAITQLRDPRVQARVLADPDLPYYLADIMNRHALQPDGTHVRGLVRLVHASIAPDDLIGTTP